MGISDCIQLVEGLLPRAPAVALLGAALGVTACERSDDGTRPTSGAGGGPPRPAYFQQTVKPGQTAVDPSATFVFESREAFPPLADARAGIVDKAHFQSRDGSLNVAAVVTEPDPNAPSDVGRYRFSLRPETPLAVNTWHQLVVESPPEFLFIPGSRYIGGVDEFELWFSTGSELRISAARWNDKSPDRFSFELSRAIDLVPEAIEVKVDGARIDSPCIEYESGCLKGIRKNWPLVTLMLPNTRARDVTIELAVLPDVENDPDGVPATVTLQPQDWADCYRGTQGAPKSVDQRCWDVTLPPAK